MLIALVAAALAEPYTLEAAVAAARQNAPDAVLLDARRALARGDAGVARAALLPQVNASAAFRHNDKAIAFANPFDPTGESEISIQKLDVANASVSASQVLFNGAAFGRALAAGHTNEAAEATRDGAALDLDLRVAATWLGARASGEVRLAAEEALKAAKSHFAVAESGLAAGTVTTLSLDRAKLAVLDAEQRLVDATRAEADALGQLSIYVGGPAQVVPTLLAAADDLPAEHAAIQAALAARPEVIAARAQQDAARSGRWMVAGEWAPAITAVGAYNYTSSPMFTDDPASWYVGVSASLPVFDGGLRFADARRVNAQIDIAAANLARVEASTAEEVRAAIRAEQSASTALQLAHAQEDTARHALGVAESAFAVGGATASDVEDTQAAVLNARVGRVRAEAQWQMARWQRLRLTGRGI